MTKKNRKEMIEFISSYNPLLEAAQNKKDKLIKNLDEGGSNKLQEFQKHYEAGLANMTKNMKMGFKNLRRSCAKY